MPLLRAGLAALLILVAIAVPAQETLRRDRPETSWPDRAAVVALREYIARSWTTLTRSVRDLPQAARDPKMKPGPGGRWPVYLSRREDRALVEGRLREALTAEQLAGLELKRLPEDWRQMKDHGLLFLPHPYVVPGGRFNEMYGWDSYFIQLGLLRDGRLDLARAMTENFLYEIDHYGTILNANRSYYLSRSQPPFLTRMVLGVFERTGDREWLAGTLPAIEKYYRFWITGAHLDPQTGLSRYFDLGDGPAPEVVSDERDAEGRTHYDRVVEYYRTHEVTDYAERRFFDPARNRLTDLFYKADRSMRESGFDPSNRFGPFSAGIVDYVPVCLNVLVYRMEEDAAAITETLGRVGEARRWRERAARRRVRLDRHLWDQASGMYLDFNVRSGKRRHYPFLTTFYPLWAGLASEAQARRVRANLALFDAPGGLMTSTTESGSQWDAPFGWAPLQLIAVDGLRRYGFEEDADRIAARFVSLVAKELQEHGTIVEKYDVRRRESDVEAGIRYGYSANQVGFGWTNAVVLELLAGRER
jgi:alpha,alpha-trehalase